ncbi:MAG: transporter [Gemmatimonadales bacterium]
MKRLPLLASLCLATPLFGQNLDPRSFVNTPVGINFVSLAYGYSSGNVLFDAAVALENADLTIQGPSGGYARALDLWGLSGKADAAAGWACADGTALFNGAPASRHVCGLTDPTAHISVNFIGAPALTMRQYPAYRQDILIGAGFRVTAPLGQYDPTRLVNIGTNRWSFKPELGISKQAGRLTLEFLGAVTFFTTNTDFFGGHTQSQDPLYSGQVNVIYTFRSGIWGGVGGVYYGGGATSTDGGPATTPQENTRVGAVLVFPIGKHNSLKAYWSSGVTTRTGTDFDTFVVSWIHLWGGKR